MEQKNIQPDRAKLVQMLAQKTGRSAAQIQKELSQGDFSGVLGGMDTASRTEAERVLSDPKLIRQVMDSPQMKELLRRLGGG